ncbi:hypothetical protein Cantr_06857 [Candida viswanathii]|uniref:Uncharacterized protein n=1 Tax=Candida viswanathii TaxID=5486 RepID=A0A367XWX7_9ASCO|nr:hypothetical protein Cantr_06857 [Candida viswanathii]
MKRDHPDSEPEQSDEVANLILRLVKQPPEIIERVISYIRKDNLSIFLDCHVLVPHVLPYFEKHVCLDSSFGEPRGPLIWQTFDPVVEEDLPRLLMRDLQEFIKRFDKYPEEVSTMVCMEVELSYEDKELRRPEDTPVDSECEDDYIEIDMQEYIPRWCEVYLDLLKNVKYWNVIEAFNEFGGVEAFDALAPYMNIRAVRIGVGQHDGLRNPEMIPVLISKIPESVERLEINLKLELRDIDYSRFTHLESLKGPVVSGDVIRLVPRILKSLDIYVVGDNREPVSFEDSGEVPPALKHFKIDSPDKFLHLDELVKQMTNLESFEVTNGCDSALIDSLPVTITSLSLTKCDIRAKSIMRFQKLKILVLLDCTFPQGLFVSEKNFPKLRTFEWKAGGDNYMRASLSGAVFPRGLYNILLEGDFIIDNFQAPPELRTLVLGSCLIPTISNFKLPDKLVQLEVRFTDLKSLNGFHFPTALMWVRISRNQKLSSMKNTNLAELKFLFYVDFRHNGDLTGSDEPDKLLRYKYSSFSQAENRDDGPANKQRRLDEDTDSSEAEVD